MEMAATTTPHLDHVASHFWATEGDRAEHGALKVRSKGVRSHQLAQERRQRCIVVVEDEPDISELLTSLFDAEGYEVVPALDADSAIRLVHSNHPDAITLDLGLPDRDGRQLLHELKSDDSTRDIPVIVVSAYSARLCADDRSLVAAVVDKPFDLSDLLRVTRNTLAAGE